MAVKSAKMGRIPDRVDIDDRPASVNSRHDYGDWKVDTVAGTKNGPALVTMVERKSGFGLIRLVNGKRSIPVARAMIEALTPHKDLVKTLTYDNGKEISDHRMVSAALAAAAYFAKPYHAWERGCNENYNGLVRQYCPKNKSLESITADDVKAALDQLNNRPRKRLDWRTPSEVFRSANKNHGVALAI